MGLHCRAAIAALAVFVAECGGSESQVEGWVATMTVRKDGNTAGITDTYFHAPGGKRFRSRAEVARHLSLA
eukprot:2206860-Prymnesium_polylepis.1